MPDITWRNETRKLRDLIPWEHNPREINKREAERLGESLEEFGQIQTIAVGPGDEILDGHQRKAVWSLLPRFGPDYEVDVRVASRPLTEKERQKLVIFLHRGTVGDWNFDELANSFELPELLEWGFEEAELQLDWGGDDSMPDPGAQVDKAAELQEKWQVQRGQVWQVGRHKVMCGDSTNAEDVARLMSGERAQGAFTSPPYAEQRKKQYGGISADEYVQWWEGIQRNVRTALLASGSFFVNIKPHCDDGERSLYVMDLVLAMKRLWGWAFIDECCWLRVGVPKMVKYRFKNAFEPIYQFSMMCKGFKFRPKAVQHDSYNVPVPGGEGVGNTNWAGWQGTASDALGITGNLFGGHEVKPGKAYPSNVIKPFSNDKGRGHPAAFAVQLAEFFLKVYSDLGDVWLDPFLGSGTTLIACEQTGRIGYGMEIEPKYVAVTLERLAGMGLEPRPPKVGTWDESAGE